MNATPRISDLQGPFLVQVGCYDSRAKVHITEISVPDVQAATRVCESYLAEEGIGSSEWAGGAVLRDDASRECVAVISYNGRVWVPSDALNPEGLALGSKQEFLP